MPFSEEEAGGSFPHSMALMFSSEPRTLGVETRLANPKGIPAGELKGISHDLTEIRQQKNSLECWLTV